MRRFVFIYILSLGVCAAANAQSWVSTTDNFGRFRIRMPVLPIKNTAGSAVMYSLDYNAQILFQVHYQDSAKLNTTTLTDPLTFFAQTLVYQTKGTLESISNVIFYPTSIQGKEIGVSYFDSGNVKHFMFIRVFFANDHLWSFSITSTAANLNSMLNNKTIFFNSIVKL